jgi:type I restriction enzyme S subunit
MGLVPDRNVIDHRYLFYFTCTLRLGDLSRATTVPSIRKSDVEDILIPVPPLERQAQIAAEIEKQFTRLDAGVEALKRLKAHLRRYRAAVLKAACEGQLVPTEASLGLTFEPGQVLVASAFLARKDGFRASTRRSKTAPGPSEHTVPFELPTGWSSAPLGQIADIQGGITKGQTRKEGNVLRAVPYLRVANVQRGYLDLSDVKTIEATESEASDLRLEPGDILFNEGGDRDKLGRGWIWSGQISDCIHQNHVFRARLLAKGIEPKFVSWYGNSFGQVYFLEQGKQTTNLASINLTKLSALPVPIPPAAEQRRIVAEVESRLSNVDAMELAVEANLLRASRLRSAILSSAFTGRLPNPQPAPTLPSGV